MSEQLKQELDTTEIDRLETKTDIDSKTIGQDETELPEGKLEDESGNESKEEDTVPMEKLLWPTLFPDFRLRRKKKSKRQKLKMQSR